MSTRDRARIIAGVVFLALYVGTGSLLHEVTVFRFAVLWLPTGVAVAGLWMLGLGYAPLVAAGTIAHRLLIGYELHETFVGAAGNTLEAALAVLLLRRMGFRPALRRLRDGGALLAAAAIAPVVSAAFGQLNHVAGLPLADLAVRFGGWWRMNALGILVVTPLVLSWADVTWRRPRARSVAEAGAIAIVLAALMRFLLTLDDGFPIGMVLAYLTVPLGLYAAVRFGVRGAATVSAAVVVLLTLGRVRGVGPFLPTADAGADTMLLELAMQAFIAVVAVTPLLLGSVIAEREDTLAEVARERGRREELLDSINRNIADGVFRCGADHVLVYANTALARLLGHAAPEEILGTSLLERIGDPALRSALEARLARDGAIQNEEVPLVRADGVHIPVLLSVNLVREPATGAMLVDGGVTDIRARKLAEERILEAQKLEALGRLAGGMAHDFNNALTVIAGCAEALRDAAPEGSPARRDADHIARAAERAAGLTRQLLAYGRGQVLAPRVVDLHAVADDMVGALERTLGARIRLVRRREGDAALARVDRGRLEEVVHLLALNARDAMPSGGALTLTTGHCTTDALPASPDADRGAWVRLQVSDTGVGMTPEVRRRAFDPFFTTRAAERRAGLGLSTVYGIVGQSGGLVWIDSAPGAGATVHVAFPLAVRDLEPELRADGREPAARMIDPDSPPRRILVAEDEPEVRRITVRALRAAGFEVLEAEDGERAWELGAAVPLDGLVTDVVMPRMGGRELASRLLAVSPALSVLFVSGHADHAFGGDRPLEPHAAFLAKPFTSATLVASVRELLARRPAPHAR